MLISLNTPAVTQTRLHLGAVAACPDRQKLWVCVYGGHLSNTHLAELPRNVSTPSTSPEEENLHVILLLLSGFLWAHLRIL